MPNTIPMQCIVMRTSINREIGKGWMRRSRMKGKEHSSAYQTGDKLRLTPVPSMTISATAQMTAKVRVAAVVLCSCGCGSLYMLVPFCICTCTCACARCACGEVAKQSRECLSRLCTVPTTPNTPFFYLSLSTSLLLPPLPLCPLFLPPPPTIATYICNLQMSRTQPRVRGCEPLALCARAKASPSPPHGWQMACAIAATALTRPGAQTSRVHGRATNSTASRRWSSSARTKVQVVLVGWERRGGAKADGW